MGSKGGSILSNPAMKTHPRLTDPVEAVKIFDHPLKFLTYEGSVNKGKGSVKIADAGAYEVISQNESRLTIDFAGAILKGEFTFSTGGRRVRRE